MCYRRRGSPALRCRFLGAGSGQGHRQDLHICLETPSQGHPATEPSSKARCGQTTSSLVSFENLLAVSLRRPYVALLFVLPVLHNLLFLINFP